MNDSDDSSEGKATKKSQSPKKGARVQLKDPEKAEEKEGPSTRRSHRNQKEDEDLEGENAKGEASKAEVKETRRVGRPKKSIESENCKCKVCSLTIKKIICEKPCISWFNFLIKGHLDD